MFQKFITNIVGDSNTNKGKKKPYYFTSWFSDNVLYGIKKLDFIHYQSYVANISPNFAFHPDFIDEGNLKLGKVLKLKTRLLSNRKMEYQLLEIGEIEGEAIKWRGIDESKIASLHSIITKDYKDIHMDLGIENN